MGSNPTSRTIVVFLLAWPVSSIISINLYGGSWGGGGGLSSSSFWLGVGVWGFVLFLGLSVGGVMFDLSVWSMDAGLVVGVCAPRLFCFCGSLVVGVGGFRVRARSDLLFVYLISVIADLCSSLMVEQTL